MILPILLYGERILRVQTFPATHADMLSPFYARLADDMLHTMRNAHGAGLSAPQVGRNLRVFVTTVQGTLSGKVFINPYITWHSPEEEEFREGCLSIPHVYEVVKRPVRIRMKYYDKDWQPQELEVSNFPARVIQHEIDHLDGVLFIDRIDEDRRHNLRHVLRRIERKQQG